MLAVSGSLLLTVAGAGRGVAAPSGPAPVEQRAGLAFRLTAGHGTFVPTSPDTVGTRGLVGVRAEVGPGGLIATSGSDELGLSTVSFGTHPIGLTEPELRGCAPIAPPGERCSAGVALDHGWLTEWWVSDPTGLRQGWTLHAPPGSDGAVALGLDVTAGALLHVDADGQAATFAGTTGRTWRYAELAAWDADGVLLPAHMEASGAGLTVWVDATGARWPLTVDPALSTITLLTGSQAASGESFGVWVRGAGDVDADGYDDVVIGASGEDSDRGAAYVIYGTSTGPALASEQRLTASSRASQDYFGGRVDGGGDFDGDGYADIAVAAYLADRSASASGAAYAYYGSATGIDSTREQELYASDGAVGDEFGFSVSSRGDVDGDGYADLAVGARRDNSGRGAAYVYYGSSTGLVVSSEQKITASDASSSDYFGVNLSASGDVDGDGYDDLVVGATHQDDDAYNGGTLYVYYGTASGLDTSTEQELRPAGLGSSDYLGAAVSADGDVDGDGYDDVVAGAPGDAAAYVFYGSSTGLVAATVDRISTSGSSTYGMAAAIVGDLDADGYDEVLLGDYTDSSATGRARLFYGSASGVLSAVSLDLEPSSGSSGHKFGHGIGGLGDVDADGHDDMAIGALGDDAGVVYAYNGGCRDIDRDGTCASSDCDDDDPDRYPGAVETVGDGIDQDCDGGDTCYVDADDDGYLVDTTSTVASTDLDCTDPGEGAATDPIDDCDDGDASVNPSADEGYGDGVDQDCDGTEICFVDADGDGYSSDSDTVVSEAIDCSGTTERTASDPGGDCDDDDPTLNPGATELIDDGIDQDCDGGDTCYADLDLDGYTDGTTTSSADLDCTDDGEATPATPTGDCDDGDADIHPAAAERTGDGVDQDCDGTEVCFVDADGDGTIDPSRTVSSPDPDCADPGEGLSSADEDCDDTDGAIYPGATEAIGDEVDTDCDGTELCYADLDLDGHPGFGTTVISADVACDGAGEGTALALEDCDETDATVHPGAIERVGDGVDQDCDGTELCFVDADGDGFIDRASTLESVDADCDDAGEASSHAATGECDDTDPTVHPGAPEGVGDGVDSDCDGTELCFVDADDDGFVDGVSGRVSTDVDCDDPGEGSATDLGGECDDADPAVHPGASEQVGDGVDSDCDGTELCFVDADQDGYVDGTTTRSSADADCTDAGEATADAPTGECDDTDPLVHPGAVDATADGVDSDCDGVELCLADADADGFTDGTTTVEAADGTCTAAGEARLDAPRGECDDTDPGVHPGAPETPGSEVDADCGGLVLCFVDADGDGFTDGVTTTASDDADCSDPGEASATTASGDCDDTDPTVHPDATEVGGDGIDNDCADGDAPASHDDPGADKSGCATAPGAPSLTWLFAGLLGVLGRRRADALPAVRPRSDA